MLLAIDIGNTNTVIGVFRDGALVDHLRIESRRAATEDEYGALLTTLLERRGMAVAETRHAIIGSVVPPLTDVFAALCRRWLKVDPMVVGPGVRTGMPILYEQPREVGADRIVNAIAAYSRVGRETIVVDFGTATTFDVVSARGEYLGGVIVPGIGISADALFARASKLPRVEIRRPEKVIGRTTITAMQSGLIYGYVGLVEGLVARIGAELGGNPHVIATGGLAPLIAAETSCIHAVDEFLTLEGLHMVWSRNVEAAR